MPRSRASRACSEQPIADAAGSSSPRPAVVVVASAPCDPGLGSAVDAGWLDSQAAASPRLVTASAVTTTAPRRRLGAVVPDDSTTGAR